MSLRRGILVTQHCDSSYRGIGYSYIYRIYAFQISQVIALYPSNCPRRTDLSLMVAAYEGCTRGVEAALCKVSQFMGVSQLYCGKWRLNESPSEECLWTALILKNPHLHPQKG